MQAIRPQPGILDIALYQGGASRADGFDTPLKLSSNESPYGPSEAAMAAFARAAASLHRYPDSGHVALRRAIGEVHGLDPDRIVCGAGSDEVISFLCQAYAGPGDEVLYTRHGFALYRIYGLAAGATPVEVPEAERRVDVDAILAAAGDRTRLVFIANPANPTGTLIGVDEVARLADGLPPGCLLVLDGAYVEFVDGHDGGAALVEARSNVVMTRSFSKLYGLGGLRIGWGYGPREVVDVLNRVRGPFNLSTAQLDTAEAAVRDRVWAGFCATQNARLRARLAEDLRALGLACDPPQANFVLPRFDSQASAEACEAYLRARGVLVRKVASYNIPEGLRITVGDEDGCRRVVAAIDGFLGGR
jgi:histidinol-phosphate aminotransferase